jgi:hypothetical protein
VIVLMWMDETAVVRNDGVGKQWVCVLGARVRVCYGQRGR